MSVRASTHTLGHFLQQFDRRLLASDEWLAWPPDAFAVCAYILKTSGAYAQVLREWPPRKRGRRIHSYKETWAGRARTIGREWRLRSAAQEPSVPKRVLRLWQVVKARCRMTELSQLASDRETCEALLHLVAAADEACANVGMLPEDDFALIANEHLRTESTLCKTVRSTTMCVLPKQHTPQSGMTIRSLTHHLSLHIGREVVPYWNFQPAGLPMTRERGSLTLLLAPWPLVVRPRQFSPAVPRTGALSEMPSRFGFFSYQPHEDPERDAVSEVEEWLKGLIAAARELTGHIDGIVFPELALTQSQFDVVRKAAHDAGAFVIAGVCRPRGNGQADVNELVVALRAPTNLLQTESETFESGARAEAEQMLHSDVRQAKHHRWQLDRSQIETYGLGTALDPSCKWWEHSELGERQVNFIALDDELTLCCLICEDLARQDPVADVVRSVGPNLVVALLMDGPQLSKRWPARYATVLADDPGSSVLTLTSAGMTQLSRPPPGCSPSRSIAMWKDSRSEALELELPAGADGLLLNLRSQHAEEWTADGRSDHDGGADGSGGSPRLRGSSFPRLSGVHPVRIAR